MGFLYGTAQSDHIFQIDAFGAVTASHMFGGSPDDGSGPVTGLIQANDGSLLGTTSQGGSENRGTVPLDSTVNGERTDAKATTGETQKRPTPQEKR
jgi:hypothetical protein